MNEFVNKYIVRSSASFKRGFSDPASFMKWYSENSRCAVAMVGRSNVGKSSLINTMFGNKTARVSKTPGRTSEINVFEFDLKLAEDRTESFFLYDLPGYGFAKVSKAMLKNWDQLMGAFFSVIDRRTLILNLQDARHPNQKSDQQLYQFIKEHDLETFMVLNKVDKLKKQKERSELKKKVKEIAHEYKKYQQFYQVSAETKLGVPELEYGLASYLIKVYEALQS